MGQEQTSKNSTLRIGRPSTAMKRGAILGDGDDVEAEGVDADGWPECG